MKDSKRILCQGRIRIYIISALVLILILFSFSADAEKKPLFLGFNEDKDSESIPQGWKHIGYFGKSKNDISLIEEGDQIIVHMKSLNSISSLITYANFKIGDYPIITWRWKVDRAVGMAMEERRDRNDCAARVRVVFGRDKGDEPLNNPLVKKVFDAVGFKMPVMEPPGIKIDYVWGNYVKKGTIIDYPGTRNHKIFVVERGNERAGTWIREKRNLLEDFRQFFGSEPPGIVAIAILTDTDQTNEGVEAYYSNVIMMSQ